MIERKFKGLIALDLDGTVFNNEKKILLVYIKV